MSLIGDYFPMKIRGTAISIYYFGIYIGYSLAFAIGNGIEKVLSWRWVFFISALAGEWGLYLCALCDLYVCVLVVYVVCAVLMSS